MKTQVCDSSPDRDHLLAICESSPGYYDAPHTWLEYMGCIFTHDLTSIVHDIFRAYYVNKYIDHHAMRSRIDKGVPHLIVSSPITIFRSHNI